MNASTPQAARSWSPYPQYKPVSMDWVDSLPAHWSVWKVSHAFRAVGSGTTPPTHLLQYYDGDVPWVTTAELREGRITETNARLKSRALDDFPTLRLFPEGTLLIAMYGATIGRLGILGVPAATNQACCALGDSDVLDPQFAFYVLWAGREPLIAAAAGGGQPNINQQKIAALRIPTPPLSEQFVIAAFLDRQTSKIEALIEKKERLITLLEEKRAALINRAVTKGLDPSAPRRDSGIPWLGSVPAHWQERKLGYLVRMTGGSTPDKGNSAYWSGEIPWVSPKDMKTSAIRGSEDHLSEVAVRECGMRVLPPGTVLIVVRGMILAHTFPVGLTTVPVTINQDMKALLPDPDCAPEFLAEVLRGRSGMVLALVEDSAHGTKCLRTDLWKGLRLYLPPLPEQHEICAWVGTTASRFNTVIAKTRKQIAKFQEYRTAMISAAVTGTIDVRGRSPAENLLT